MRKPLIILSLVFFLCALSVNITGANGAIWTRKAPITIDTATNLTDYQIGINVTNKLGMMGDFRDLKFTADDNTTLLPFWIESYADSEWVYIWIKGNFTNGTLIYVWYGNPAVASLSNITATMIMGDDFDKGVATAFDNTTLGNALSKVESGGYMNLSMSPSACGGGDTAMLTSKNKLPSDMEYVIETKTRIDNFCSGTSNIGFLAIANKSTQPVIGYVGAGGDAISETFYRLDNEIYHVRYDYPAGTSLFWKESTTTWESGWSGSSVSGATGRYYHQYFYSNGTYWWSNMTDTTTGSLMFSTTDNAVPWSDHSDPDNTWVFQGKYYDWAGDYGLSESIDYIFVRQYTSSEPTYSIGAEENIGENYPYVTLNEPSNGGTFANNLVVPLNFTVVSNVSITGCDLWSDKTGSWEYLASNSSEVVNNTKTTINGAFTSSGTYLWNVNCTDTAGKQDTYYMNYSFTIIDTLPSSVNLVSPANGSSTNDTTPDFTFNFMDTVSLTGSATLYLNKTYQSDNFTETTPFVANYYASNYNVPCVNSLATNWQIKCYHFGGTNASYGGGLVSDSYVSNESDKTWHKIADFPNPNYGLNALPMRDGERILIVYDDTTTHRSYFYDIANNSYEALPDAPVTGSPSCASPEAGIAFRGVDLNISSEYDDLYYFVGGGGYQGCDEMHIWNDTSQSWLTGDDINLDGLVGIEASSYFVANHTAYSIGGRGWNTTLSGTQDWGCIKWIPTTPTTGTWLHCADPPAEYEKRFIASYFGYYDNKFHLIGGYNETEALTATVTSWWRHLIFYWENESYEQGINNTFEVVAGGSANLGNGAFVFAINCNASATPFYSLYSTTVFEYTVAGFTEWTNYGSNSSALNGTNTVITANQNLTVGQTYGWYVSVVDESGNRGQSDIWTLTLIPESPPIAVSGFDYHKIINITYPYNETSDYIMLMRLNSSDINYTLSDGTLLFTTTDNSTNLSHFTESWDYGAGGISEIWVKVPQSVTSILVWYGNTTPMSGMALSNATATFPQADTGDVGLNGATQIDGNGLINDGGWSHRGGSESTGYDFVYTNLQSYGDSGLGMMINTTTSESIIIPANLTTLHYRFYDNGSIANHYSGGIWSGDFSGIAGAEITVDTTLANSDIYYIYEFSDKSWVVSNISRTVGWHEVKVVYDRLNEYFDESCAESDPEYMCYKGNSSIWLDGEFLADTSMYSVVEGNTISAVLSVCESLAPSCPVAEGIFWDNVLLYNSTVIEPTYILSEPSLNNPPQITYVESISPVNPTEGTISTFTINFTAYDADGVGDLNISSHSMTITGETNPVVTQIDSACVNYENGTNTASFTCTFSLNYYDDPQNYRMNASIYDNEVTLGYNDSIDFTYNELKAWTMSPSSITYGSLNCGIGAPQGATDDPMVLNNTGNANVTNITVKAYDLIGQSDGSWIISASDFTVNTVDSSGGDVMLNDTYVQIASSEIPFGQGSTESLFYWIEALPCPLKSQSYQSVWEISGA